MYKKDLTKNYPYSTHTVSEEVYQYFTAKAEKSVSIGTPCIVFSKSRTVYKGIEDLEYMISIALCNEGVRHNQIYKVI
jgi:hypothetical protein